MKLKEAQDIAVDFMTKIADQCMKGDIVGSIRRKRPEVHDIDLVVIPKPGLFLAAMPVRMRGDKIVRLSYRGMDIDIYIADDKTYEVLKLIRTGSPGHNIMLCIEAQKRGLKLKADGTGLVDAAGNVLDNTESGILEKLLGHYVEPEDREVIKSL